MRYAASSTTAPDELALRDAARKAGMRSLRTDGARLLADGATSLAELLRVTRDA